MNGREPPGESPPGPCPSRSAAGFRPCRTARAAVVLAASLIAAAWWPAAIRIAAAADGDELQPEDPRELTFMRVHVPAGRLADVPLGSGRYVPMSAREFAEGVARLTDAAAPKAGLAAPPALTLATAARLVVEVQPDGTVTGAAEFDVGWPAADGAVADPTVTRGREMPLVGFDVRAGVMRTAAGTGAAMIFGRRDGGIAMATPADGTYGFSFTIHRPPEADRLRLPLPLVPALASSVVLVVPRGLRPVTTGGPAGATLWEPLDPPTPPGATDPAEPRSRWRMAVGPRHGIECMLVPDEAAPTMVSVWSDIAILGPQAWFTANVVPAAAWREGALELEMDPAVVVTAVECKSGGIGPISWRVHADGSRLEIELPPGLVGRRDPVALRGAAPIADGGGMVPMVRPPERMWRSGGTSLRLPADLSAVAVEPEQCVAVSPAAAASWPLVPGGPPGEAAMAGEKRDVNDGDAPWFWLEHQSSRAAVRLAWRPADPVFDVARVTTVDLSPAAVTARATCDVRVDRGAAFDLTAWVAPRWIIDSVELVEGLSAADPEKPSRRLAAAAPEDGVDWRFDAGILRVGLPSAARSGRHLFLRVIGRHPGIPLESDFSTTAIDMVRFDGESDRGALLELRTNPETAIEFDGVDPPTPVPEARLAVLAEDGPVRARSWAGHRAAARSARLVRRRPPLDVSTQVRLTVRDERLTEAFTFECRPAGSDLDSIVVQFSTVSEDPIVWSLLPPAVGTVSARRMDPPDRRPGAGPPPPGGDRWLVEIAPAARGPVTIRGARTSALVRRTPVPLAWVDGATSTAGQVFVRDAGRSRLSVVNHRLAELPRRRPDSDFIGEFAFDATVAADGADGPAAELVPWAGEPRACAWREVVTSWCHASGRTEHETVFEIDNHGRTTVLVEVQRGQRLQGVLIDDVRMPLGDGAAATGSVAVELPLGRRLVKLVVRTAVDRPPRPQRGVQLAWQVTAAPVRLADIPVLEREWVLLLPPGLEILRRGRGVWIVGGGEAEDVLGRLFAAAVRPAAAGSLSTGAAAASESAAEPPREGFRPVRLVQDGQDVAGVTVVPSAALALTKTVAALLAAALLSVLPRRGRAAAVVALVAFGTGALWAEPPFSGIFRAAFWVGLATFLVVTRAAAGAGRRGGWLVAVVAGLTAVPAGAAPPGAAADDGRGPLKVFMMPPAPGADAATATVLVPERLFRLLAQGEQGGAATAGVRVLAARVTWTVPADGRTICRLLVDIDADEGGILRLEQADETARFLAGSCLVDGTAAACRLHAGDRGLWSPPLPAGRHAIEVGIVPASEQRGDVELATATIPVAPQSLVSLRAPALPVGSFACETAGSDGVFTPATSAPASGDEVTFDAATANRVRLVRSRSGARLADGPRAVASRNDIRWEPDSCRLVASFAIEPGDAILRQIVVGCDEGLEWLPAEPAPGADRQFAAAPAVAIRPLAAGRHLVEVIAPRAGPVRFEMSFRMPLPAPTGIFDLPGAWLEQAAVDSRSIRLAIDAALAARAEPPPGWVAAAPGEGDMGAGRWTWQRDVQRGGQPAGGRVRLATERRPQATRGTQQQSLVFSGEQVLLRLDARLEAPAAVVTLPLDVPAGCVIDRVTMTEEGPPRSDGGERTVIDTRLSRRSPILAEIVCQRPRAGTFRLEVDARLPGRPPPSGELPILRARLAEPSANRIDWQLDWRTQDPLELAVSEGGRVLAAGASGSIDRAADAGAIEYRLGPAAAAAAAPPAIASTEVSQTAGGERVELADIRLAIDPRGGMWGIAAFELVAARNPLVLRLPRDWRLFDVSIDGKPVAGLTPVPPPAEHTDRHADAFWEVRLLDTGWPRTIVALFKGDLGSAAVAGEPLALVPPTLVGLSTRTVLWTLDLPRGLRPLVAGPAHLAPADILAAERRAARQRLDEEFSAALERASGGDRSRLAEFLEARREGTMPVADSAWARNRTAAATTGPARFTVAVSGPAAGGDEIPTLRLVHVWDARRTGRLLATALLVAAALFEGARRRGLAAALRGAWVAPAGLLLGAAWTVWLDPAWPGAVGGMFAAAWLAFAWSRAARGVAARGGPDAVGERGTGSDIAIDVVTELHRR